MINRIYTNLKSKVLGRLLKNARRKDLPKRLQCYPECKSFFQSGIGLEIGGPSGIFRRKSIIPVYPVAARIDNCNFGSHTVWEGVINEGETFVFNKKRAPGRQIVAEGSNLQCIGSSFYDFVLSSHCIEHLANPLLGLAEWIRVLKDHGLLVLVFPHKDGAFDHRRPVTSLEHLIQDFDNQTNEGDLTHLEEILELHDLSKDPGAGDIEAFRERSKRNLENRCLHHHVFDTRLAIETVNYMGLQILAVELFKPFHIIIIAKKTGPDEAADNEAFKGMNTAPYWLNQVPQV